MTTTTLTNATIKHTCGHKTIVEVDATTKAFVKHFAAQPCFECQPMKTVTRLCGCVEEVKREFGSPRRFESAAMQNCANCQ